MFRPTVELATPNSNLSGALPVELNEYDPTVSRGKTDGERFYGQRNTESPHSVVTRDGRFVPTTPEHTWDIEHYQ